MISATSTRRWMRRWKAIDYTGFAARKAKAKGEGKLRGIGLSCYIEACGIAPSKAVGSLGAGVGLWESAEVGGSPVGTIEILTGSHSHGQGHETSFAQVVAEGARHFDQSGPDRPWRHRQGAVRHGHLRLTLCGGRIDRHRQGDGEDGGESQEDRRASAGGVGRRHRHREWRVQGHRHRQVDRVSDGGAGGLYRAQPARRRWGKA